LDVGINLNIQFSTINTCTAGKKKLQADKPDSVVGYHLSVPVITCRDRSAYPGSVPIASGVERAVLK